MSLNIPNLDRLIAHLEAQPPERFNMAYTELKERDCGTAACIGGHICALFGMSWGEACDALSSVDSLSTLYCPPDWVNERTARHKRYPLNRAIATLKCLRDTYLRTGEVVVDWGPEPGEEPAASWAAPVVSPVEVIKPLPESLTQYVREPATVEG